MVLHEILSDIRLALAVAIFCSGGAAATLWWMLIYMIGEHEHKRKNLKKGDKSNEGR